MPTLLKLDSYAPILEMLGQREDPGRATLIWIVGVFAGIILLLLAASLMRTRLRRRLHLGRGMDQLEQLTARHDLNYVEQVTVERLAKAAKLKNPTQLVTSVDVFDQAVATRMERVLKMPWLEMEEGLAHVTYLKVDRAEAELLTGLTDLAAAARRLTEYGPKEIVLTQSSGVTVYVDGEIHQAPFTPRSLAGRTGRGDTCFMTYLGKRLSATPAEACRWAAAVTTLKQEKPGPWDGDITAVEQLL